MLADCKDEHSGKENNFSVLILLSALRELLLHKIIEAHKFVDAEKSPANTAHNQGIEQEILDVNQLKLSP